MKNLIIVFVFAVFVTATADNPVETKKNLEGNEGIVHNVESDEVTETPGDHENDLSINQARLLPTDLISGGVNIVKNVTSSLINAIKPPSSEPLKNAENLSKFASSIKSSYIKNDRTLPEDPYQDISDYLKHKHSGDLQIDANKALRTRKSLNTIFASTKDEDLHKYGSNYNILVPNTIYVGLVREFLDGLIQ